MNQDHHLYSAQSDKPVHRFVDDFAAMAEKNEFVVNNKTTMDMKETFTRHGGSVPDTFDLHMIQICKPTKADKSLTANPERAILMPKFVHVFSDQGKTQIRFLSYGPDQITDLVPGDPDFAGSLEQTYTKIRSMIDESI